MVGAGAKSNIKKGFVGHGQESAFYLLHNGVITGLGLESIIIYAVFFQSSL